MAKFKAIFFDLDDTLFDDRGGYNRALQVSCERVASQIRGVFADELFDLYCRVSDRLWLHFDRWGHGLGADGVRRYVWNEVFIASDIRVADEYIDETARIYTMERRSRQEWLPEAKETLLRLSETHAIGLITNGATEIQREKIAKLELETLCRTVQVAEECGCSKPDPRIFRRAMEEVGVTADESLMVGDRPETDIVGAHGVGMTAAWIAPKSEQWPLTDPPPCFQIESVVQLPDLL